MMSKKTILVTGSTDGIGLLTAKKLASKGHEVLLHGRNKSKLEAAAGEIGGKTASYVADLSRMADVVAMADAVAQNHARLDVLINNAGILKTPNPRTADGLDIRFMVNTFAPYALTRRLLPIIPKEGRVINLSSAAQAPVDLDAMAGQGALDEMSAYAQSKLAITIWSRELANELGDGPVIIAVNPGSLLASKMVKEGFGVDGKDMQIGVDILCRASLDADFADASGKYFDNDIGSFNQPNAAARDARHASEVMRTIEECVKRLS
ncbi:MAG: SDR family NAD(P)-dependent oxidoreductase [Geminicoccales bacterium]